MSLLFIVLIILKLTSMRKEVLKTGMNAAEAYEAPACEVMELRTEGVLCASGEIDPGDLPDWEGDNGDSDWG